MAAVKEGGGAREQRSKNGTPYDFFTAFLLLFPVADPWSVGGRLSRRMDQPDMRGISEGFDLIVFTPMTITLVIIDIVIILQHIHPWELKAAIIFAISLSVVVSNAILIYRFWRSRRVVEFPNTLQDRAVAAAPQQ